MHHSCLKGTPSSSTMMTTVTTNTSLQRMHSVGAITNNTLSTDIHLAGQSQPSAATLGHANNGSQTKMTLIGSGGGGQDPLVSCGPASNGNPSVRMGNASNGHNANPLNQTVRQQNQQAPLPPLIQWNATGSSSGGVNNGSASGPLVDPADDSRSFSWQPRARSSSGGHLSGCRSKVNFNDTGNFGDTITVVARDQRHAEAEEDDDDYEEEEEEEIAIEGEDHNNGSGRDCLVASATTDSLKKHSKQKVTTMCSTNKGKGGGGGWVAQPSVTFQTDCGGGNARYGKTWI